MANIRIRPNGIIQYDFSIYGVRFRETSGLPATSGNLKKINVQLALKTFEYREFFPHSKKCKQFESIKRVKRPELFTPYFDDDAVAWTKRLAHQWRNRYQRSISGTLNRYLIPFFGDIAINKITLSSILQAGADSSQSLYRPILLRYRADRKLSINSIINKHLTTRIIWERQKDL